MWVAAHCHCQDFICCFCGKATDATAPWPLQGIHFSFTEHHYYHYWLMILLFCTQKHVGCGVQLIVFVVVVLRQLATTTIAIAACSHQVDCAVFLMEYQGSSGQVSFAPR